MKLRLRLNSGRKAGRGERFLYLGFHLAAWELILLLDLQYCVEGCWNAAWQQYVRRLSLSFFELHQRPG